MDHNPRVIEPSRLPLAIRAMSDMGEAEAGAAERLASRQRRALRLSAVDPDAAALLRQEAQALGVVVLDGGAGREPIRHDLRIGVIGIPPICEDLYPFLSSIGAHVVFNEIQRQFSMPYPTKTLVEQYSQYTYPYDIFSRLEDIQQEIKQRNIRGLIHYVQRFCHRHIHDKIIRKHIRLPILTLDCDRPGPLDGAMKTRIEAFIEMLKYYQSETPVASGVEIS